jgi:hypothetical protein
MARKLKVYRTSAGFSDAYVAAPSQKAALAAWGADANLFARGIAEEVTDPALMAAPLHKPGEVLTVSRGDLEAHLKALQASPKTRRAKTGPSVDMQPVKRRQSRPRKRPPPTRDKLEAAEQALAAFEETARRELAERERQRDEAERALARFRADMDTRLARLDRQRRSALESYQDAMRKWSDGQPGPGARSE